MKSLDEIERILAEHKEELCRKYAIKAIGIFGSFVRGEQTETSDLDVLVDFHELPDLLTFCEIERVLEEILGVNVDLVEKSSIKRRIKDRILSEAVTV
ncbi:MAG TPA: nucleotidyltransferase [candidate division Zixibacteria bacterium]|nr:nucleotidyltransferase [candidate division Zixibacteria bacterium]